LQLIYEDAIDKTPKSSTDQAWAFLNFTYWNGGASQTQSMYIDDLYISTSPPPEFGVPEPTSAALGFLAVIGILTRRRRPHCFR